MSPIPQWLSPHPHGGPRLSVLFVLGALLSALSILSLVLASPRFAGIRKARLALSSYREVIARRSVRSLSFAPFANACTSSASGNWNNAATWTNCGGGTPTFADDVFIQSGHTVTLTQNEACNDLNISTGTTSATTGSEGVVGLGSNTLSVNGRLRCYFAIVGTTPGTDTSTIGPGPVTITAASGGKLIFVGNSRNITNTGQWAATNTASTTTFGVEINLTAGQTATMQTSVKASSWSIVSGKLDAGSNAISADPGTTGQGDVTIGANGTLISSATGSSNEFIRRTGATAGGTLTVNGLLQLSGSAPRVAMSTINFNGTVEYSGASQTLAIASLGGADPTTYTNLKLSSSGTKTTVASKTTSINANGSLEMAGGATPPTFAVGAGGTFSISSTGTTILYTASGAQTVGPEWIANFQNAKINNSGGVTLNAVKTINGFLTIGDVVSNSILNDGGFQITSTGTLNLSNGSTFKLGSAASGTNFPAFTTTNIGVVTTVEYASNHPQTIAAVNYSNLTSSGTGARTLASSGTIGIGEAFTPGTNSYTVTGSTVDFLKATNQNIPAFQYNNLSNSGDGQRTYANGGTVKIAGTFSYGNGGPHTVTGSTIELNGTSAQSLPNQGFTFSNLSINNSAGVTAGTTGSPVNVNGTLALMTGALSNGVGNNLTMGSGATIDRSSGNIANTPLGSSYNVIYSGASGVNSGAELPASSSTLNNLTINKAGGVTLTANAQANGILTLTNGILTTTDAFSLTLGGSASSTGASSSSYVNGNLKKIYSSPGSFVFDLGDAGYSPVTVNATAGTGDVTAKAVHGYALSGANNNVLQRFWNLTNNGITAADLTFQWLATDVHGTEALYVAFKSDGGTASAIPAVVNTGTHTGTVLAQTSFSTWTFGEPAAPTAVKLSRWNAASYENGVQLNWESGYEVNNLGYNVYRERNGQREQLTPALIAGSALKVGSQRKLTAGYGYQWFDSKGTPSTAYYLEAIDLNGSRDLIGPIYPTPGDGHSPNARKRATLLTELNGAEIGPSVRSEQASPAAVEKTEKAKANENSSDDSITPQPPVSQTSLPSSRAVKISVSRAGWYRVTQSELLAAGLDANADPRRLQLFVGGEEVPIVVNANGNRLSSGDSIEFYGQAVDTLSTNTQVYWLINGTTGGKRITRPKTPKPSNQDWSNLVGGSFGMTVERADKLIYFSSLLNGDATNIFGPVITSNPTTQNVTVNNLDTTSTQAQLSVTLQGATEVDHQVQVELNGTPVGVVSFSGRQHPTQSFTVSRALLHEGVNEVRLSATGGGTDVSLVDSVSLTYAHSYRADSNALRFSVAAGRTVVVSGFNSSAIRVMDVTNPSNPTEVAPQISSLNGGYALKLQNSGGSSRTFMAFTDDLASHPAALTANQPSNLTTMAAADMLIVTHKNFRSAIEPLAAQRRSEGLTVSVVDIEDVYDQFSFGVHTPNALHDFLSWTNNHWPHAPRYLLLVGDSSWDPKDSLGQGFGDFVPTKLIDTVILETASDDWLSDFDGDGVADIATGRLPARTAADATLMVDKILNYEHERQAGLALRGALLVADSGFESESSATAALLPSNIPITRINRADVGSDDLTRTQIVTNLNNGPLVANYFGHGSVTVWTGAGLLDSELATSLTNNNRPTLFVLMTCLNGYSHDAYIDSLGESLLKAPQGGAMAVWASSGFTESGPQFVMSSQFYQQLFSSTSVRLGDGFKPAKLTISDKDVQRTWLLLGDPSMRLR